MSPTIGADVPKDLQEELDAHREQGESRSAAIKRLLRRQFAAEESPPLQIQAANVAMITSAVLLFIYLGTLIPQNRWIYFSGLLLFLTNVLLKLHAGRYSPPSPSDVIRAATDRVRQ